MKLKITEVEELLGFKLKNEEIISCLEKIRYGVKDDGDIIKVSVPSYRADILHNCDLIEDIAIAYGFDKINPGFQQLRPQESPTRFPGSGIQ